MHADAGAARTIAGLLAFGVFLYLVFLSGSEGFNLGTPVLISMVGLIIVVMFGPEDLERLIRAWRGAHPNKEREEEDDP